MKKQLILSIGVFCFIILVTVLVILYGRGYLLRYTNGKLEVSGTGILVVKSTPDGAEVRINDHLTTATNNTINLFPGSYEVTISKNGYFSWHKKITVSKEVVTTADALLFPTAPTLENITLTGANNPVIDPSFTKLAYTVASQSATAKNGIYVLNMNGQSFLPLSGGSTQIAADGQSDSFSLADLSWSPDGQTLLATISAQRANPSTYLLNTNTFNQTPQDVTETLAQVQSQWLKEEEQKNTTLLATIKPALRTFLTANASILAWSPDGTKLLYQASESASMPTIVTPPLKGSNSTPQIRDIQKGNIYTYDTKEDKNYLIQTADLHFGVDYTLTWFPDNRHLIKVHDKKIDLVEYDNTNATTIYALPFIGNFVFPWPNGSKIVILTNFSTPTIDPHLYTINLK